MTEPKPHDKYDERIYADKKALEVIDGQRIRIRELERQLSVTSAVGATLTPARIEVAVRHACKFHRVDEDTATRLWPQVWECLNKCEPIAISAMNAQLDEYTAAAKRWYEAASPYATPEALKEAILHLRAGGDAPEKYKHNPVGRCLGYECVSETELGCRFPHCGCPRKSVATDRGTKV